MRKTTAALIATFALFFAASGLVISGSVALGSFGAEDTSVNDSQVIPGNSPHVIPGNSPHSIVDAFSMVIPGNSPHGWTWTNVIPGNSPH